MGRIVGVCEALRGRKKEGKKMFRGLHKSMATMKKDERKLERIQSGTNMDHIKQVFEETKF